LKAARPGNGLSTFHCGHNITPTAQTLELTTAPLHGQVEVPHEILPLGFGGCRELESNMKPRNGK